MNDALYAERLDRINRTIRLEPVDRVPVVINATAFAPRFMGMSIADFCADPEAASDVVVATLGRLRDVDGWNGLPIGRISVGLTGAWLSKIAVPGRDLPADSLWQVHELEVMSVEDYDTIIDKGWPAFLGEHLPKIIDMQEFEEGVAWSIHNLPRVAQKFRDAGFVPMGGGYIALPFEALCGARSMQRFFLDLYRMPDKVKAAMDVIMPELIPPLLGQAQLSGAVGVWIGGWRAASALVAPRFWEEFVFPYIRQTVEVLAENGIISVLHVDQDWTRDLARFREFPSKKCILNPDGATDIRKAKEILGDHMAIMGDVPSSLFAAGTPESICAYVRDLVRDIGTTGLILAPGCDAPINTKPENMEAFVSAAREYGEVRQAV